MRLRGRVCSAECLCINFCWLLAIDWGIEDFQQKTEKSDFSGYWTDRSCGKNPLGKWTILLENVVKSCSPNKRDGGAQGGFSQETWDQVCDRFFDGLVSGEWWVKSGNSNRETRAIFGAERRLRRVNPAPERRRGGGRLRRLSTSLEGSEERARRSGSSQCATVSYMRPPGHDRNNRVVGEGLDRKHRPKCQRRLVELLVDQKDRQKSIRGQWVEQKPLFERDKWAESSRNPQRGNWSLRRRNSGMHLSCRRRSVGERWG
jgi:hypothetical protein